MGQQHTSSSHAIVVTGGSSPDPRLVGRLPLADHVVCADSGFDHAVSLGVPVTVLVGDLDSISPSGRRLAESRGIEIRVAPTDKDLTDTELALTECVTRGARSVTLVSGGGDRLDHLLGIVAALASDHLADLERLDAWIGRDHVSIVRATRPVSLALTPGALVSLLPLDGPVHGVRTSGLRWPLDGDTLLPQRARGVSNEATDGRVDVRIESGVLAVVVPQALDHPHPIGGPI